mmetsp:Transcript_46336/g.107857  ORF Transcript_46336/g.107857 Transcript_46336/m.107857 type:complete len:778 (+) Transcript_46336:74-2407(+)
MALSLPALPAAPAAISGFTGSLRCRAAHGSLSQEHLGGQVAWRSWTQSLAGLQAKEVSACGIELWELLHALAMGLTTPLLWELMVPLADVMNRCAKAGTQESEKCRAMLTATTAVAEGLCNQKAVQSPVLESSQAMVESLRASCGLLVANPSLLSGESGRAPEVWMRAALQVGSTQLEASVLSQQLLAVCSEVLDAANSKAQAPLLNLGWKLLKQLSVHPQCDPAVAVEIILGAGAQCGKHLEELEASLCSEHKKGPGDTVHLAMFHGSNVLRLLRDAVALKKAPSVWIADLLMVLAAGSNPERLNTDAGMTPTLAKARELLEKLTKALWEQLPNGSQHSRVASAMSRFLSKHWALLACDGTVGEASGLASASTCTAIEEEFGTQSAEVEWRDADLNAIAVLCAGGAPQFRPHLLTWALSPTLALYDLSIRVHTKLPALQGVDSNLEWLQILLDMLTCSGKLGQEEHQVSSCCVSMLNACPRSAIVPWMESTLLPLCTQHSSPGLKVLLRKLGMVRSMEQIIAPFAAHFLASACSTKHGLNGQDFATEASFRTLAALLSTIPGDQDVAFRDLQERLQAVMDRATIPVELRLAAWEAHAAACFQTHCAANFNTSLRYALKHFSRSRSAGVRVANMIATAPPSMVREGATVILQGLCEMHGPLRVAGLTAAASLQAANQRAEVAALPAELAAAADAAVLVFSKSRAQETQAFGGHAHGDLELSEDMPLDRKRRKLLESLVALPQHIDEEGGNVDIQRTQSLCNAALHRLHGWMAPSVGF